jgi:2-dehydro-3-deoxyglucarate aldolase
MNFTLQTIPSTLVSEVLSNSQFDGIVLDTEHGLFNNETLFACIQVITLKQKQCYVRFTHLDKSLVRLALDAGVDGVIFSTVETQSQGNDIIKYCTYPILGGKRGQGLVRENNWGLDPLLPIKPTIIAQLETKTSVQNLDQILKCGFDKYVIGPYDLSSSIGHPADWDNLEYKDLIRILYENIPNSKLGSFITTNNDIKKYKKSNLPTPSFIIWGMDVDFLINGTQNPDIWNT